MNGQRIIDALQGVLDGDVVPPKPEAGEFTRLGLVRRIQSIIAKHCPDDYEESWPTKAAYDIADAIIFGTLYGAQPVDRSFKLQDNHPPSHMIVLAKVMRERHGEDVMATWLEEYAEQFNDLLRRSEVGRASAREAKST